MPTPQPIHTQRAPLAESSLGCGQALTPQQRGKEVHALVKWAFTERSRAICRGWNRKDPAALQMHLSALQAWLLHFPCPSAETMRLFYHQQWGAVLAVMPGNAAGLKKLDRLKTLLLGA